MPEIIHHFRSGKMNKDLDERLVPDGEYRDALNIEVATSDSAEVGTVQNTLGNTQKSFISQIGQKCVGSIANGKGDFIIWFIQGGIISGEGRNYIVQYIPGSETIKPILVDNYQCKRTTSTAISSTTLAVTSVGTVRPGMEVTATTSTGAANYPAGTTVVSVGPGTNITTSAAPTINLLQGADVIFKAESVLKFTGQMITAVNIIDGMLFWTDGTNEPKKIHIKRSALGTPNILEHSLHYVQDEVASTTATDPRKYVREQDITVIKENPKFAPVLNMSNTKRANLNGGNVVVESVVNRTFVDNNGDALVAPMALTIDFQGAVPDYQVGDILILSSSLDDQNFDDEYEIRLEVTSSSITNTGWGVNLLSIHEGTNAGLDTWTCVLKQDKPMFEFKFPRFGYRYKYEDGEYSAFSPWSEPAFLPSDFDYNPYKGYNLGMTNTLRSLIVKEFNKDHSTLTPRTPDGVVEIDVLYKESSNNNVYVVKSIKRKGKKNLPDDEWLADEISIESELISAAVDSLQSLRPWDNVPLSAKAQEITANRIIYGNYVQNHSLVNQQGKIAPSFNLNISPYSAYVEKEPSKSLKSQRTYQLGIVYRDRYGRETPVLTDKTATTTLPKASAIDYSSIKVGMNSSPPTFADSFKYYLKETSNEYYNLAMDRYYLAEDGNVWLSFPSSERNKVSEETFLILKKRHSSDDFVEEDARYKVVAIKNEAPLFLKTQKKSYGTLGNSGNTTLLASGYPQTEFGFIHVDQDDFDASSLEATASESDLVLRIRGNGAVTKWYDINSISLQGSGSGAKYVINIDKQFGSEVDSVTGGGNASTQTRKGVSIEIAKEVTKNKPEFEGRFFVKIYRDYTLEKNILKGQADTNYTVVTARTIPFLSKGSKAKRKWWRRIWKRSAFFLDDIATDNNDDGGGPGGNGAPVGGNKIDISFGGIWPEGGDFGVGYSVETDALDFVRRLDAVGSKFRFQNDPDQTIYEIEHVKTTSRLRNYHDEAHGLGNVSGYFNDGSNKRKKWTLTVTPNIGSGPSGYTPETTGNLWYNSPSGDGGGGGTGTPSPDVMEFLEEYFEDDSFTSNNPAIWETEPREDVGLDIYYEVSDAFPITDHNSVKTLDWFNCYSFGNGVESNRIRDDFNAVTIDKGPRASTTLAIPYERETKGSGLIFSGIYNSTSGVNNTNQFIQADTITKDLNQGYGTIQKLFTRDNNLLVCCEDKILKIYANKDALFNADGSSNLIASNKVLGNSDPYAGEYGISLNPESFVAKEFRAYFTDRNRGVVIRLSNDGITPISMHGMEDFFRDEMLNTHNLIGSYDDKKQTYNLTIRKKSALEKTIAFSEKIKGWTSRYSFIPESGVSLNNEYYTFNNGEIWKHHDNQTRNNFYGTQYSSSINVLLNDAPNIVKSFKTLNYEGSQAYIKETLNDGEYYNNVSKQGWYEAGLSTNLQTGSVYEFKNKENKWFNYIHGDATNLSNLDTQEISVQGLGTAVVSNDEGRTEYTLTINENND